VYPSSENIIRFAINVLEHKDLAVQVGSLVVFEILSVRWAPSQLDTGSKGSRLRNFEDAHLLDQDCGYKKVEFHIPAWVPISSECPLSSFENRSDFCH
jgi:hypothetical protein